MTPIYREIPNTNYLVSCFGTVRTKDSFKLLKQQLHYKGHYKIGLSINKKSKNYFVHRLVAMLWVDNPNKRKNKIVNHLDGVKTNNFWTNFEWTTISGNTKHAVEMGFIDMEKVRSFKKINR